MFDVVLNFADAKSEMICHHPIPLSKQALDNTKSLLSYEQIGLNSE